MTGPVLSIVLPAFAEGAHLPRTVRAVRDAVVPLGVPFEIVVADDGSPDETWPALTNLRRDIPELRAVSLARNFGKEAAILAGLDLAEGDAIVVMDCDLQHPPQLIPEMYALWRQGYQVVNAVKAHRGREARLHGWAARAFYAIFERLAATPLAGSADFKLLDREVADVYRRLPERNTFFRGLVSWMGYRQADIPFEVAPRAGGRSSWSPVKLAGLATGMITAFSTAPLHLVTLFGALFLLFALGLAGQTLYVYLSGGAVAGFTTVILLLLFVSALLMISLGIIGQYIAKIYDEVKRRPRYLVKDYLEDSRPAGITDFAGYRDRTRRSIARTHSAS